ncbi:MAG: cupredoxin domain-containing protein [Candidatus Nanopelagicales bacterium]|nr:cupredoxin domain-containing protein [Candidatus Nanopelagicales bacterium]
MRTTSIASIALAATLGLAACSSSSTYTTPPAPASPSAVPSPTKATAAEPEVSIKNLAFQPNATAASVGATIMWTNEDSTAHTVTFDDKTMGSSGNLAPGDIFSATFPKAGTYNYHCAIHPSMTGTVTIT